MEITTDRFFSPAHQQPENWLNLQQYLADLGHSFCVEPQPKQFVGGFGNLNYLIQMDETSYVLRRPPHGPLPPGANDMVREYTVTSRLWKKFPLAPKGILLCENCDILGAPFLIMQYRPGAIIQMEVPEWLLDKTDQLSKMMVEVLVDFQSVHPASVQLENLGRPHGFLQRALRGWVKRFHIAAKDVYPNDDQPTSVADIIAWLEKQPVPESSHTLLHNDFKLNNIVLDREDFTRPVALLDWDMCTLGDPLFDFATLLSYWFEPSDPPALNKVGQMPTATSSGWMNRHEVAQYYAQISGRDLSDLHYYRVLTAFKHCIIFMQIYARYCRGTTADPRIVELGAVLDLLFEFTHDIIQQRYF